MSTASGPAALGSKDYLLPPRSLSERLAPFLQEGDHARLRRFIRGAPRQFFPGLAELETATAEQIETCKDNRLGPVLDAIITTALEGVEYGLPDLVLSANETFYRIYQRAHGTQFPGVAGVELDAPWVWSEVLKRVYLLGAVLVDRRLFGEAAQLISQQIELDGSRGDYLWARHGLTMLARARGVRGTGLVALTVREFDREPWFLEPFGDDRERATSRLCQFDYLQCVLAIYHSKRVESAYPSFAWYYNHRTEPIVATLVSDPDVRGAVIPAISDQELAEIISALDTLAGRQAILAAGWDSGEWSDRRIPEFLAANLPNPQG